MTHRDEQGHFISDEEAEARGLTGGQEPGEVAGEETPTPEFGEAQRGESIFVDTGRGGTEGVEAGSPFVPTLERLAEEAHYGGYYRIFLNGSELVNPEDSPETIEPGMRIAITSYDKVGAA